MNGIFQLPISIFSAEKSPYIDNTNLSMKFQNSHNAKTGGQTSKGEQSERFDVKRNTNAVLSIMYTVMGNVLRPIKYRPMSDSETNAAA